MNTYHIGHRVNGVWRYTTVICTMEQLLVYIRDIMRDCQKITITQEG